MPAAFGPFQMTTVEGMLLPAAGVGSRAKAQPSTVATTAAAESESEAITLGLIYHAMVGSVIAFDNTYAFIADVACTYGATEGETGSQMQAAWTLIADPNWTPS